MLFNGYKKRENFFGVVPDYLLGAGNTQNLAGYLVHYGYLFNFTDFWDLRLDASFDWNKRDKWIAKGAMGLEQRAQEKAMDILKNHKVDPLPDDVLKELRTIVNKANDTLV